MSSRREGMGFQAFTISVSLAAPASSLILDLQQGLGPPPAREIEDSIAAYKQAAMWGDTSLNIAIDLVRLGRIDEAKAQVKFMLEKNDLKFTQAKWRETYNYSDPSIVDGEVADLAKAGLPEK
jgi:hypothetical protein